MAIFYNYIKGTAGNGTKTTYIHFNDNEADYPYINFDKDDNNTKGLGQIVTTEGDAQTIGKNITIGGTLETKGETTVNSLLANAGATIKGALKIQHGSTTAEFNYTSSANLVKLNKALHIWGRNFYIKTDGYVEAQYFNATSDRNAKTNIQLLLTALPIITRTPINTFNYKSTPDKRTVGLIAQDLEQIRLPNFHGSDLVNQPTEEGGYKTINESKLVYLLWRAVQEQQEQIERQQQQIEELRRKLS